MISNIPDEIKKIKVGNTPVGTIIWYLAIGFVIGGIVTKQLDSNATVEANKKAAKDYTEQEVGGLRSDWERENKEVHRRLEDLEKKVFNK